MRMACSGRLRLERENKACSAHRAGFDESTRGTGVRNRTGEPDVTAERSVRSPDGRLSERELPGAGQARAGVASSAPTPNQTSSELVQGAGGNAPARSESLRVSWDDGDDA